MLQLSKIGAKIKREWEIKYWINRNYYIDIVRFQNWEIVQTESNRSYMHHYLHHYVAFRSFPTTSSEQPDT